MDDGIAPDPEKGITLTFKVTVPGGRTAAINFRDRVLGAIAPLGLRASLIEPETTVRLMVNHSVLTALTTKTTGGES